MVFVALEAMTAFQLAEFEMVSQDLLAEIGTRLYSRMTLDADLVNGWVVVQDGNYRFYVEAEGDSVRVRIVIFEYLAGEVRWLQMPVPPLALLPDEMSTPRRRSGTRTGPHATNAQD